MKKLYQEFFCIPEQGKVSDKVLLARMAAAAVFMVLCLCGMSASAYAYFTCSVSSASNVIQAAEFKAEMEIESLTDSSASLITEIVGGAAEADRRFSVDLPAGRYKITLDPQEVNPTGFFIIKIGDKEYYTRQLVEEGTTKTLEFELELSEKYEVKFLAHWGTMSSYPDGNVVNENNNRIVPFGEFLNLSVIGEDATVGEDEDANTENGEDAGDSEGAGAGEDSGTGEDAGDSEGAGAGEGSGTGEDAGDSEGAGAGEGSGTGEDAGNSEGAGAGEGSDTGESVGTGEGAGNSEGAGENSGADADNDNSLSAGESDDTGASTGSD